MGRFIQMFRCYRPPLRTDQRSLLVVDDDPASRRLLRRVLAPLGFRLSEAGSVAEAEAVLRAERFDVLLTDVVLPDGNGCALALDAHARQAGLVVVFLSGYGRQILAKYGLVDPAARFVEKPFDGQELRDQVTSAVAARDGAA